MLKVGKLVLLIDFVIFDAASAEPWRMLCPLELTDIFVSDAGPKSEAPG